MRVLFVCTGNTCRSPMLEYAFNFYVKAHDIKNISADSAGTMRHEKPMTEETKTVLRAHGIEFDEAKTSKFCDEALLKSSDFVFTMTKEQAEFLTDLYGEEYNIIPLCSLLGKDVDDPYGKGLTAYENTYKVFEKVIPMILRYLTKTGV